jgi:hypothetical protein
MDARRGTFKAWALGVLAVVAFGTAACSSHYRFGRQTRRYFTQQVVSPGGVRGGPAGLDSEEASLIHARYRQSLAPEGHSDQSSEGDVLIISEDGRNVRGATRGQNR